MIIILFLSIMLRTAKKVGYDTFANRQGRSMAYTKYVYRMVLFISMIFLFFPVFTVARPDTLYLYRDPTAGFAERVDDLLSRMTLEEKVSQMMSRTPHDLVRFGIPGYAWSGMSAHNIERGDANTVFPHAIAQASTWDPALVYRIGTALSDEARGLYNSGNSGMGLTFWAPVVELARDPRWGRTHECYGEDPFLTGQIAGAWVRGIQGNDPHYLKCIAAPKHFVANNEEWDRHNGSSDIDEELLHEYYLKPYEVLVKEDHAMGIMAAYNALNGIPCIANRMLLTDILRDSWGFTGTVVTDCNGIKDLFDGHHYVNSPEEAIVAAVNAGIDIECGDYFKQYLLYLAKRNIVTEEVITRAVKRIMLSRFMLGLYDPPDRVPYNKISEKVVDSQQHRLLARQAAREAIILLKNQGNLLPLDPNKLTSVAVIGPLAGVALLGGYTGKYSHAVSPLEGLEDVLGKKNVAYVKGTEVKVALPAIPSSCLMPAGGKPGQHGLLGEYFSDTSFSGTPVFTRVDTVVDFNFGKRSPGGGISNQYYSIRWTGKLIAPVTGDYYIGGSFDDILCLWLDGKKIIDKRKNRNHSSVAVKVALKKGKKYDIRLDFTQLWYKGSVKLWGGIPDPHKFDRAVEAAGKADVTIVVAGIDDSVEGEGRDRSSLHLPGDQSDLIKAVMKANPRTVVVLQNGGPVSVNWCAAHVPAILETFCNGEEGGHALADVLFGKYNPAGRLPLTVYRSVKQLPDMSDYDIRKGRTYMYPNLSKLDPEEPDPLYVFGFGLSYTSFKYGKIKLGAHKIHAGDTVHVRVKVTNTGKRAGDEVVQLYARDVKAPVPRPVKQLVAFSRVHLKPGKSKNVNLDFPVSALQYWDTEKKDFVTDPGAVELFVGGSSDDERNRAGIQITKGSK